MKRASAATDGDGGSTRDGESTRGAAPGFGNKPGPEAFALESAGLARLSHISLETRDLARSLEFYTRVFGFQQIWDRRLGGAEFEAIVATPGAQSRMLRGLVAGGAVLQLWEHDWREPRDAHTTLLSFEVRDAHAAHASLKAEGVVCVSEPVEFDNCFAFVILDPDQHSLEIIQWKGPATPYRCPSR